jgi:hypothetical protein
MEFSLLEQFHGSTASSRERYLVRQVNVDLHRILIAGTFAAQLKSVEVASSRATRQHAVAKELQR